MFISNDLIYVEFNGKYLAYNTKWNNGSLVDESLYNLLSQGLIDSLEKELKEQEILVFKNCGILFDDETEYKKNYCRLPVLSSDTYKFSPRTVYFHITERCNLKCSYCYNSNNREDKDYLTKEAVFEILEKLKAIDVKQIIFTGGECTLREDFGEIIKFASKLGFKLQVLTNGTNLETIMTSIDCISKVILSLDTLSENHNERIGLDVYRLIDKLGEIPFKVRNKVSIRTVISKSNEKTFKGVRNFSLENGFSHTVSIRLPNSQEDMDEIPDCKIFINFGVEEDKESYECIDCSTCAAGKGIISINSNGDIYPCQCFGFDKFLLSNILRENWVEETESAILSCGLIDWNADNADDCKDCKYKFLCGGGCPALNYRINGNISKTVNEICPCRMVEAENELKSLIYNIGGNIC